MLKSIDDAELQKQAVECQKMAEVMRAEMIYLTKYGNDTMHWGGSFSSAEIFAVLYNTVLNCRNTELSFREKDKFLLSKGHAALGLYTAMHQVGMLSDEQMKTYQADNSSISELMEAKPEWGFETSGGSLGINLAYGVGLALLAKKKGYSYRVVVEVGDGEIDEGAIWESIMSTSQFKLDNIVLVIDANTVQSDGRTEDIMSWAHLDDRMKAFGWNILSVDGHDCMQLIDAFVNHFEKEKPLAIIANTVKGKGVSFMENNYLWHDRVLRGEELEKAIAEVGCDVKFRY